MGALISWVCRADHPVQERSEYEPAITINRGAWAVCLQGGDDEHKWDAIEPSAVETLRYHRTTAPEVSAVALEK